MFVKCHVVDLLVFEEEQNDIESMKGSLGEKFVLKDIGDSKQFLGIEMNWTTPGVGSFRRANLIKIPSIK